MKPLRIAVAGCGYFSRFQYEAWREMVAVEIVGNCALDLAEAESVALEYGVARSFEDPQALLDAVKPDIFDIVTPPPTHLDLVREAAARGIATICQKPLAPSLAEAEALVEIAEEAGIMLAVHENFRFQPWYRELRRLIDMDWFGRLHAMAFRFRPGDGQGPRAYLDRQPYFQAMKRFLIHETIIHYIDTFRYLGGEVASVYAQLRRLNPVIAGEDAGIVMLGFQSGVSGLIDGNRLNDHPAANTRLTHGEFWLEGETGVMRLDGDGGLWWKAHGLPETRHDYVWRDRGFAGDCVYAFQRHVVDHLRDQGALETAGRDYLRNIRIEEAVYESDRSGHRVDLDFEV